MNRYFTGIAVIILTASFTAEISQGKKTKAKPAAAPAPHARALSCATDSLAPYINGSKDVIILDKRENPQGKEKALILFPARTGLKDPLYFSITTAAFIRPSSALADISKYGLRVTSGSCLHHGGQVGHGPCEPGKLFDRIEPENIQLLRSFMISTIKRMPEVVKKYQSAIDAAPPMQKPKQSAAESALQALQECSQSFPDPEVLKAIGEAENSLGKKALPAAGQQPGGTL